MRGMDDLLSRPFQSRGVRMRVKPSPNWLNNDLIAANRVMAILSIRRLCIVTYYARRDYTNEIKTCDELLKCRLR